MQIAVGGRQVAFGVDHVAPGRHARRRAQVRFGPHALVAGEDHTQLPADHAEHGQVEDGHEPVDAAAAGRECEGLVEAHADEAAGRRAAVVGGHRQRGYVPGAVGVEGHPVAGDQRRRGVTPHRFEVVQALEPLGRRQQHAHDADRELAELVEHADEDAACLVGAVFFGEQFGRVAEGLEEDGALDVAPKLGARLVAAEQIGPEWLDRAGGHDQLGEVPQLGVAHPS